MRVASSPIYYLVYTRWETPRYLTFVPFFMVKIYRNDGFLGIKNTLWLSYAIPCGRAYRERPPNVIYMLTSQSAAMLFLAEMSQVQELCQGWPPLSPSAQLSLLPSRPRRQTAAEVAAGKSLRRFSQLYFSDQLEHTTFSFPLTRHSHSCCQEGHSIKLI